jgi:hypothetical protein
MFFPSLRSLSCLVFVALTGAACGAWAQSREPERAEPPQAPMREEPSRTQRASSLSDAVRRVQRETGGQVLGAERVQFDGRDINRIKVLDDRGRVRYMDDDPQRAAPERRRGGPPREEALPRPRGDNPPRR